LPSNPLFGNPAPSDIFGITLPLLIALAAAVLVAVADLGPPRLALDLAASRPDHQRHDHQHRGVRRDRLPRPADLQTRRQRRRRVRRLHAARRPSTNLPVVGWILAMFLNQGPIAMSTIIVLVIGVQIWLFRSRWGLRTRAVGEHPRAAETVGIDVIRLRYRNVMIAGSSPASPAPS
jgi:hypothetical protein